MGRWSVKIFFLLLAFSLSIYPAGGAYKEDSADIQENLTLIAANDELSFPEAYIGQISSEQKMIAIVQEDAPYQLYIESTSLVADERRKLPPSVLEFKLESAPNWLSASDGRVSLLTTPEVPDKKGRRKEILFRLNIPPTVEVGLYKGEITVIASVY